jgi:serine/threonine protein kinase
MNEGGQTGGHLAVSALVTDLSKLDQIHSGPRHKLYRGRISDTPIVVKASSAELPKEGAVASLRHEYELLRELNLPGIIRVLGVAPVGNGVALLMEDAGETNLAALIRSRRLSISDFLTIAVQLADAVARLHLVRIIHRDIHPGNVVWSSESELATLCDFAIAGTLATLALERPNSRQLEGTLPYMSPEQTGRTGRSVDWRADLYSLGATFYEMLTGAPPFTEGDVVSLAHAQIARQARSPHEINLQVPPALSRIVLKLLEKQPEQRYQSASALAEDLREAKKQWLDRQPSNRFRLPPMRSHAG